MTVDQLIAVLQRVPDKSAVVMFTYDSRVCAPVVTCVDYVPDAGAQEKRIFASDFFTEGTPAPKKPALVLRSEDREEWDWFHADPSYRDDCKDDLNLYMEDEGQS